jgi:hypothetical protein
MNSMSIVLKGYLEPYYAKEYIVDCKGDFGEECLEVSESTIAPDDLDLLDDYLFYRDHEVIQPPISLGGVSHNIYTNEDMGLKVFVNLYKGMYKRADIDGRVEEKVLGQMEIRLDYTKFRNGGYHKDGLSVFELINHECEKNKIYLLYYEEYEIYLIPSIIIDVEEADDGLAKKYLEIIQYSAIGGTYPFYKDDLQNPEELNLFKLKIFNGKNTYYYAQFKSSLELEYVNRKFSIGVKQHVKDNSERNILLSMDTECYFKKVTDKWMEFIKSCIAELTGEGHYYKKTSILSELKQLKIAEELPSIITCFLEELEEKEKLGDVVVESKNSQRAREFFINHSIMTTLIPEELEANRLPTLDRVFEHIFSANEDFKYQGEDILNFSELKNL